MQYVIFGIITIFFLSFCSAMEQKQSGSFLEKIHFSKESEKEMLTLTQLCSKAVLYYFHTNPHALAKNYETDRPNITVILDKLPLACVGHLLHAIKPIEHPKFNYINDIGYSRLLRKDPDHNLIVESLDDSFTIPDKKDYNHCCLSRDENHIISHHGRVKRYR